MAVVIVGISFALARTAWRIFLPGFGATVSTMVGFGMAVGTYLAVMSVGTGFKTAFLIQTEHPARYLIQRTGARSESGSSLLNQEVFVGIENPDIDIRSPEFLVMARSLPLLRENTFAPLLIRGITETAFVFRPAFEITRGRIFTPGRAEAIVGEAAAKTFANMEVGSTISHHDLELATWTIVGHFSTGGDVHESEAWVDLAASQSVYRGGSNMLSVVWVMLRHGASLASVQAALAADPRYPVTIKPESLVFEERSGVALDRLFVFAAVVGCVLLFGSALVAVAVTQTVVANCWRAIRTMHTIGFPRATLAWCAVLTVLALGVLGGMAGVTVAYFIFDGMQTSTADGYALQTSFDFTVTLGSAVSGLLALSAVVSAVGLGAASYAMRSRTLGAR